MTKLPWCPQHNCRGKELVHCSQPGWSLHSFLILRCAFLQLRQNSEFDTSAYFSSKRNVKNFVLSASRVKSSLLLLIIESIIEKFSINFLQPWPFLRLELSFILLVTKLPQIPQSMAFIHLDDIFQMKTHNYDTYWRKASILIGGEEWWGCTFYSRMWCRRAISQSFLFFFTVHKHEQ